MLGHCKESSALTTLIGLTQPVKKFFRWKLPPKSPEFLAALDALRQSSHDKRVQTIRQTALRSRDPEIVAAAKEGVRPDA